VALGLLAAVAVVALGTWYSSTQPQQWSADVSLLLAPDTSGGASQTSAFYDTLSSGQLPATAAAIVDERHFLLEIKKSLSLPSQAPVRVVVTQVPATAVIKVDVTARDKQTAMAVADAFPGEVIPDVNRLLSPYTLSSLGGAQGTARLSSLSHVQWAAVIAVAALVVGIAVQQLVLLLSRAWRRQRSSEPS